jgi:ribonuclease P protein component
MRSACAFFSVLFRYDENRDVPRVGFTVPKRLGKAVLRNRLRRRLREAVRMELHRVSGGWEFVFQPRAAAADAPLEKLREEVARVFQKCAAQSS